MDTKKTAKEEIIALAEKTKHYCDLLIEQSDNWLSEEEGAKNVEKRLSKSSDNKKKNKKITGCKGFKIIIGLLLSISFASSVIARPSDIPTAKATEKVTEKVTDIATEKAFEKATAKAAEKASDIPTDIPDSLPPESSLHPRLDSLLSLLPSAKEDTTTALLYKEIGRAYEFAGKNETAKEYYLKIKELSNKINYHYGYFDYVSLYTDILIKNGLYDSIIVINKEALALAQQIENQELEATSKTNIGIGYHLKEYFETSLSYYLDAMKYYESADDRLAMGHVYDMLQTAYWQMGRFNDALIYGEKAIDILNKETDPYLYSVSLLNLTNTYLDSYPRQSAKATECTDKALQIAKDNGYAYIEANAYINYCKINYTDMHECEKYGKLALKMGLEMDAPEIIALSQVNLGYTSIYFGRYKEAEEWLRQALETALKYEFNYIIYESYRKFARISYALHNQKQALTYDYQADSVKNLIMNEKIMRATEELNVKYETEKKVFEIERQQHVIKRQNWHRVILLTGFVICLTFLLLFWYMLRLRTKRNRALAEMNATKDRFFSIISHDLKNPAIAQRDALQLLTEHADKWDAQSLSQYYGELLRSADGQVELLYNLLNWAQVQTGRMPYSPTPFDLVSALRPDITLIKNMAARKGITFEIQLPETAIITGDSNMLTTVVRNLLTNAIKFTAANGTVTLCLKKENNHYTLSVSDTGTGMNKQQLQDLFRIDCQRSQAGTAGEQGSGLGLTVCKELIEKHGSNLHVESEEGKGSRFTFTI